MALDCDKKGPTPGLTRVVCYIENFGRAFTATVGSQTVRKVFYCYIRTQVLSPASSRKAGLYDTAKICTNKPASISYRL